MDKGIDYEVWGPRVLSVVRIVVGLLFLEHGTQKLLGFPPPPSPLNPLMGSVAITDIQGVIEALGGLLIAIGFFTRPVAFILCGDMAVAYFWAHAPGGFFPINNRGDGAILYCFIFLYLCVAGGGAWSADKSREG